MSEEEQPKRPTQRLHDEGTDPGQFDFNSITGAQRVFSDFARDLRRENKRKNKRSQITLLATIFGLGGASATGVYLSDLLSWFAENRLSLESKADHAKDVADLRQQIDAIGIKMDDLPKRVAEEVKRERRR